METQHLAANQTASEFVRDRNQTLRHLPRVLVRRKLITKHRIDRPSALDNTADQELRVTQSWHLVATCVLPPESSAIRSPRVIDYRLQLIDRDLSQRSLGGCCGFVGGIH